MSRGYNYIKALLQGPGNSGGQDFRDTINGTDDLNGNRSLNTHVTNALPQEEALDTHTQLLELISDLLEKKEDSSGERGYITDGFGTRNKACVTSRGQLVTSPFDFSTIFNNELDTITTAFNVTPPKTNKQFVITDIVLYANKDVGPSDATVELYEADSVSGLTATTTIFKQEMLKNTTVPLTGLNIILNQGKWLNIKTDDNSIFSNIAGYFVSAE